MSSPEQLYGQLAQILSNRKNRILEIEILIPGLGPLLYDGNSIGITKNALVQAFVVARRIFFGELVHMQQGDILAALSRAETGVQIGDERKLANDDFAVATEIMLLFDCEHLTACNWRKRRLTAVVADRGSASIFSAERDELFTWLLETERTLMTTYLCSPLNRHTKSPTLWQHRLWIMRQLLKIQCDSFAQLATSEEQCGMSKLKTMRHLLEDELAVVLRAGDQHPRNYYAFSYMRQLHSDLSCHIESSQDMTRHESADSSSLLAGYMVDRSQSWCLAHPRDISGWMFLLYLLEAAASEQVQGNAVSRVIQFALDVGWEGESLWVFVDLATRKFAVVENLQFATLVRENAHVNKPLGERAVNEIPLPQKHWRLWLTRARALWTSHSVTTDGNEIVPTGEV